MSLVVRGAGTAINKLHVDGEEFLGASRKVGRCITRLCHPLRFETLEPEMNALAARITAVNDIAEQLLKANPPGKDSIVSTQKQLNHRWLGRAGREFCGAWDGGRKMRWEGGLEDAGGQGHVKRLGPGQGDKRMERVVEYTKGERCRERASRCNWTGQGS